ncbi:gastrin-releasing peptide [Sceloporus undulatus]|uniref:gastrin-releasing peptide n=1 Tax=Sceloporus undulatus TaxID=8520 RepID=UPI001C4B1D57|nr:gastrin-releasing peptide [Sceloporus undulatus]
MARAEVLLGHRQHPGSGLLGLLGLWALLALVLGGSGAGAAPLQGGDGGAPPMAKIYPRGSHWAVGHFMGKKSTGDFPYIYEERNESPFPSLPDNIKQLGDYLQWEETLKQFLRLLDGNENRSTQVLREELPFSAKSAWEAEDNSSLKDMMDYLLQVLDRKETTPS